MFDEWIDGKKEEMISSLKQTISYPSISEETNDSTMPFGKACHDVLEYVLNLGKELGFRTKNLDHYCGYIEFGEGEELVGILGHLDVVPADDLWTHPPFSATIENNKLYGRGAIDDKGPVISSLYAMKAVMDIVKVKKRVRLILGLNEEKSWKCISYYKLHEEAPTIGFSPDADFPCIYAEKGILTMFLKQDYSPSSPIIITDIDTNHNAINVVPKYCKVILTSTSNIIQTSILPFIQEYIEKNHASIEFKLIDDRHVEVVSHGISAHAAHPDLGKNAISHMIVFLNALWKVHHMKSSLFDFFDQAIHLEYNGELLGIDAEDESGNLTLNVGHFSLKDNQFQIGMNLRVPVTKSLDELSSQIQNKVISYDKAILCEIHGKKEPLYISKEDPLVTTLCSIFNQKTGMQASPIAIGGATYARAFPNCISFGANMPGHKDMCHQVDEFIDLDIFFISSKIYAEAIYELAK